MANIQALQALRPATALVITLLLSACSAEPRAPETTTVSPYLPVEQFDGQSAMSYVDELLKISPRVSGTTNAYKAAQHLSDTLRGFGYTPIIEAFTDRVPSGSNTFYNVFAHSKPKAKHWIILGSHFDTKTGIADDFEGANDSGSSTGTLLALAELIAKQSTLPDINIVFAFFDGEEAVKRYSPLDGLHGSRHFAARLKKEKQSVLGVIILDMIGDQNLRITIPSDSDKALARAAFKSAEDIGARDKIGYARHGILDDHTPFLEAGFPAIDLIDFKYGTNGSDNVYWHTHADTRDKLSPESLEITGRITIGMLNQLLSTHDQ